MYRIYTKRKGIPIGYVRKIWLTMRLTTVILITTLMQVSATGIAQRVTLRENGASLQSIIQKIRNQTGYDFLFDYKLIEKAKKVDVNVQEALLDEVLNKIFQDQELTYTIKDRSVVIKEKMPSFLDRVASAFRAVDIRGKIVGEDGAPIAGATVRVKGTKKSAVSDQNGTFYIPGVDENAVLVISYVGYATKEIAAVTAATGNIFLVMVSSDLNEVEINKGYYTEKRRLSTGSVGRVTAEEISKQPVSNPLAALQGRVAGLTITQNTGIPGGNFTVQIRGRNSIRNNFNDNGNNPLYIVDGVPFSPGNLDILSVSGSSLYPAGAVAGANPLNSINPSDIASIEILKDADATAIYGSRASNGVILITTKKGNIGQIQVDANAYTGVGKVTRKMKLLNSQQYREMRYEAFKNDGYLSFLEDPQYNSFYPDLKIWDPNKYTDWQKELIGGSATTTDAQLGFSGGTTNIQYRFGGGYHRETTVFPGDFADNRASFHFNLNNVSRNQRFKSQISANYSASLSNLLTRDLTTDALTLAPNAPALIDSDGNLNFENTTFTDNPLSYTKQPYNARTNNLISSGLFSYEILPDLIFKATAGYTNTFRKEVRKNPVSSYLPGSGAVNRSSFGNSSLNSWKIEPQVNWQKHIGSNTTLNLLVGATFQSDIIEQNSQSARGFLSEELMDNIGAVPAANVTSVYSGSKYNYSAIFARINYDFKGKYLLNLTGRRDGSSRFGPDRKFGNFGAVGAAWLFSEEKYLKEKSTWLSFGKLRGSYGITGSDQIPNYGFLNTYTTVGGGQYQGVAGLAPSRLLNPDFKWETNEKFELALELGFISDRFLLTTSYYRNRSSDQLVGYPLPATAGFLSVQYNLDATVQNTGLEFELNTSVVKTKAFSWNSFLNISLPKNKLVSYPNIEASSYASTYIVGEPLAIRRNYTALGVDKQTGLYKVQDIDNNNVYNLNDKTKIMLLDPNFYGGLQNNLKYKGFQLDFLFQFVKQKGDNYLYSFAPPGYTGNQPIEVMQRWQKPDDLTSIQKFTLSDVEYYRNRDSDAALSDASFIRLKNLAVSYQLEQKTIEKIKLRACRVYLQGQNLITITNYKGLDPETQGRILPPLNVITAGLQISL